MTDTLLIFLTTSEDRRVYLLRDVDAETSKKICWFHGRIKLESDMDTAVRHRYKWLVKYLKTRREDRIFDSVSECGTTMPIMILIREERRSPTLVVIGL